MGLLQGLNDLILGENLTHKYLLIILIIIIPNF